MDKQLIEYIYCTTQVVIQRKYDLKNFFENKELQEAFERCMTTPNELLTEKELIFKNMAMADIKSQQKYEDEILNKRAFGVAASYLN